jgi:A/G-specific adenine glycosylase
VTRFDGVMPRDPEALRSLPGVGPYSVAAIRAFAYDEDDAACDVNTRRVVQRLRLGIEFPARATAAQLDVLARELVPAGHGHDWNSAVMDLGASICTARAPKCLLCPLRAACAAAPIDAVKLETLRRKYSRDPSPQAAMKFERTTRYARGRIVDRLRQLPPGQSISLLDLHRDLRERLSERDVDGMRVLVDGLVRDGIARRAGDAVALAE